MPFGASTRALCLEFVRFHQGEYEAAKRSTSLSALVRGYLNAIVRGQAPVILDTDSDDRDREQRAVLVAELQSSDMILGFTPSRSKT